MNKKYAIALVIFLCACVSSFGQGSETFTSLNAPIGTYANGSYTGDNGLVWTYDGARRVTGTYNITGASIGFGTTATGTRNVEATSDANGVGDLTYSVSRYFTGGSASDRSIEVYVDGVLYDSYTLAAEGPVYTRSFTANETGAVSIEFRSVGSRQIVIDDVSWTAAVVSDPNLSITGTTDHGSSCLSTAATTIEYTIDNDGIIPATGITVVSDDPQFVVSNLSSTVIAASGDATFDVTFTASSLGAQGAEITVTSSVVTSNSPTIDLTGTGINAPTITTQPTNQSEVIPNTATYSVVASNATSYQWQVDEGSGWNDVTDGSGDTTNTYITDTTDDSMNGYQYRCVVTNSCGSINSNAATLTLIYGSPSNAQSLSGCFLDTSTSLTWNDPATPPTGGYVIFAIEGTTDPITPPNDASTYTANPNYNAAPFETPATLGKVVYKGNGTNASITGLTEGQTYSFRIFAYNGETLTGWSNGTSGGSNLEDIAQGDVRNFVPIPLTNQVTLNWLNPLPTSCWDDILIVANQGAVVFAPSGNGAAYTANSVYSGPNQVIYKGSANSVAVTGLTNGVNYCFRAFIRRGTTWTNGVEICAVPSLTYCASNGDGTDGYLTLVRNVEFNTINNASSNTDNDYSDFTGISTTVTLGETYNLDIRVNTDGLFTTTTMVWIDWNNDGDFSDSNEDYDLGPAYNAVDGSTDNSPLAVEIPTNAVIASTRMRVSTKYDNPIDAPTPCETGFDGEVEDYTINIVQPVNAEINIKGNNISIPNGFNAPYGLNNTLYGLQTLLTTSPAKTFEIQNIGVANLNLTGAPLVEITGANAGDFSVSVQPSGATIATNVIRTFQITFTPTADGVRTATVSIANSDSDENPYTFDIQGTGQCSGTFTSSLWPIEGPENTEVTITSATDLTGATATVNGITMAIVSTTASELVVLVPVGATSGNLNVVFSNGCTSTNAFTVIDTLISGCETATGAVIPPDLFITELSDATSGSSSLIEIFNGTAASIDLSDYSIRVFNNGSASPSTTANLAGTLAPGGLHVISIGTTSCDLSGNGLMGGLPDQTFNSAGGINFDLNSSDMIQLYNSTTTTVIDVFGVFGSNNWANGLGIGGDGVNYRRQNTATNLPSTTFDINDWDEIDWTSCGDSDYSNFGLYDFSLGIPPSVSVLNAPMFNCLSAIQLSVTGTEGVIGGLGLVYQWYYLVPNTANFVVVPDNADFDNVTSPMLDVLDPISYENYQFYCQLRENGASCYTASNSVKFDVPRTEWDGFVWSDGAPTLSSFAVINGDYNTSIANLQACNLTINAGNTLTVSNSSFVEVQNNVISNGDINISTRGNFVQRGIGVLAGSFSASGTTTVSKTTSNFFDDGVNYHYTYWSSPVVSANIVGMFPNPVGSRRYYFDTSNYLDTDGDDIDDTTPYDWQVASGSMDLGTGYAVTATTPPSFPYNNTAVFSGDFNTGDITKSIVVNGFAGDNDWNFIGNPYPSAIDFNDLHSTNSTIIEGAAFLWSQSAPPDIVNPGNEVFNFNTSDYAIISAGSGNTAGGAVGLPPNDFIPSGQGFFVRGLAAGTLTFDNSMRMADATSNTIFFEANNQNATIGEDETEDSMPNRLWLDLTSDNGVFNQILIAYVEGATNGIDSWSYDVPRNMSTGTYANLYSLINATATKFAIQGKTPESLNLEEVIPLGINTSIDVATVYKISIPKIEGAFLEETPIYLKDNLLNTIHNLKDSDYSFTSSVGTFNDRFEIVFTEDSLSNSGNTLSSNDLTIIERTNGKVWFKVTGAIVMDTIEIIDLQGRTIYNFEVTNNANAVYDLSALSNATYIAKVTLDDGRVIIKKDVKRF